ncbi:hypothetical protein L596_023113 [Steinernema carpocapsae]|uniref:CCR4-NOT transcription complex subunit 9 n=1 Tax=Steinernema carpocapsae TaxID=34508 RepID=A0A4U5MDH1_STECR|nr:hypothetical protein L596_023113 [Steinernema carpocapsae]
MDFQYQMEPLDSAMMMPEETTEEMHQKIYAWINDLAEPDKREVALLELRNPGNEQQKTRNGARTCPLDMALLRHDGRPPPRGHFRIPNHHASHLNCHAVQQGLQRPRPDAVRRIPQGNATAFSTGAYTPVPVPFPPHDQNHAAVRVSEVNVTRSDRRPCEDGRARSDPVPPLHRDHPLCLRIMEQGTELSRTVATFILQKILLDNTGLSYICQTYERFSHVAMILGKMVLQLAKEQSARLLKHVVRCYSRLSDNPRALQALHQCLPDQLKDDTFADTFKTDKSTYHWWLQLLKNLKLKTEEEVMAAESSLADLIGSPAEA